MFVCLFVHVYVYLLNELPVLVKFLEISVPVLLSVSLSLSLANHRIVIFYVVVDALQKLVEKQNQLIKNTRKRDRYTHIHYKKMASNVTDDLWRDCVTWLTRCKVIPADHKANWPDSEIRVLALTLRDGVILCNLLNSIDPNALDMKDFNRKPQMAQVCIHNSLTHMVVVFGVSFLHGLLKFPFFFK